VRIGIHDCFLGKNISETIVPNDKHNVMIDVMTVIKSAGHYNGEFPVKRKDGTIFQAFYTFGILKDTDSKNAGLVGVSVDITERIRMEDELHKKDIMLVRFRLLQVSFSPKRV